MNHCITIMNSGESQLPPYEGAGHLRRESGSGRCQGDSQDPQPVNAEGQPSGSRGGCCGREMLARTRARRWEGHSRSLTRRRPRLAGAARSPSRRSQGEPHEDRPGPAPSSLVRPRGECQTHPASPAASVAAPPCARTARQRERSAPAMAATAVCAVRPAAQRGRVQANDRFGVQGLPAARRSARAGRRLTAPSRACRQGWAGCSAAVGVMPG